MSDFAEMLRNAAGGGTGVAGGLGSVFAEEPVSLTIFVQDRNYLGNPPLSPVQYEAVRHIERIYYPQTYLQMADEFEQHKVGGRMHVGPYTTWRDEPYWSQAIRMTNFCTLQWGKGSGKDHICRIASMRIAYLLLCLRSPQEYYNMPAQDTIHLLNVASTSGQAQQAFFMPIVRAVKTGWFKDRCDPKMNVISYAKNIESISGHSDAESQEGLNLMLGIADEIDAFKSKKEMMVRRGASPREPTKSAEGILTMMRTSAMTRFPGVFKVVAISYPRYLGSMIQQLTADAKSDIQRNGIDSRHYVSGPMPTWEVNPRVTKEDFAQDYKDNPEEARKMYECKPTRGTSPYFRNSAAVDACFTPKRQLPIDVSYRIEDKSGTPVWVPEYRFSPDFFPVKGAVYAMHADLARVGDKAGLAMAHVQKYSEHEAVAEDQDGAPHPIREIRPHVKTDFVISYSSNLSTTPPREIQIRWARQLCFELIKMGFNIRRFTFDMFQSADSMQILESHGIESERVSTDTSEDPWRTLRDLMYEGRLTIPSLATEDPTASFLLREELLSLTRLPNGRVDHPFDGSKDEADALAGAVYGAVSLGGQEDDTGERAYYAAPDITVGSVFDLPVGMHPGRLWETEMPALF